MPTNWSFTTLFQRLSKWPHHFPYLRELHDRMLQYVREKSDDARSDGQSARQAAGYLAEQIFKQLRTFDDRKHRSLDWLHDLIGKLNDEAKGLILQAKDLRDMVKQLQLLKSQLDSDRCPIDPAALEKQALSNVEKSGRFEDKTWKIYTKYEHEKISRFEIAEEMKIDPDTVFIYVTRVRKVIQAEIDRLQTEAKRRGRNKPSQ